MIYCTSTGEKVNTYAQYLKTEHWKLKKVEFSAKNPRSCFVCRSAANLQVHHKTYTKLGNEPLSHLVYLCGECHLAIHGAIKRIEASGHVKHEFDTEAYRSALKNFKKLARDTAVRKERDKHHKAKKEVKHILRKKAA